MLIALLIEAAGCGVAATARDGSPTTTKVTNDSPGWHSVKVLLSKDRIRMSPSEAERPTAEPGSDALEKLIATAPGGAVIQLASGRYPVIVDLTARRSIVTITGSGDRKLPTIAGAELWGAQNVRFVDVRFIGEVDIDHSPILHYQQPARNVELLDSVVDCGSRASTPFTVGIVVRGGSKDVRLLGDWVHNCVDGFGSHAQDVPSVDIWITHCLFSDFPGDAIELGGLRHVVINHDVITGAIDPARRIHNDDIFLFGHTSHVQIINDVVANSARMLILIQNDTAETGTHSDNNSRILIAHDLLYGAGAVAIQDQSGINVSVIGDTIWDDRLGSPWLVRSRYPWTVASPYTLVVDNIIDGYLLYELTATIENHNLIINPDRHYSYGAGDIVGVQPEFVEPGAGDFKLVPGSAGSEGGVALSDGLRSANGRRLSTDAFGFSLPTHPALGAVQSDDPSIAWGVPRFRSGA